MQTTLKTIVNAYPISNEEYEVLDQKFGKLAHYAAWQLQKKNSKNSLINDPDDDVQELRIALIRAGSYTKRQIYIESCFEALKTHLKDKFIKKLVKELQTLWDCRRQHGANRQKFGEFQELMLEKLVLRFVPKEDRPDKQRPLTVDVEFSRYCKQIVWNEQRNLGKQITRGKDFRKGMVSLSDFDYLGSC